MCGRRKMLPLLIAHPTVSLGASSVQDMIAVVAFHYSTTARTRKSNDPPARHRQ